MAGLSVSMSSAGAGGDWPNPVVEVEEAIYDHAPANNGAGPLWCYGCTCIVRYGEEVVASGLETIPELKPLNNCRWTLYRRSEKGWVMQQADAQGRQREPCPLGIYSNGRVFLSTNPTLAPPNQYDGLANPHLLEFHAKDLKAVAIPLRPVWARNPGFNEHSYRGLGVDGRNGELVVMNNYMYDEQHWAFLDRHGNWTNRGIIHYPIRGCYQEVALVNRACHILAIGDVVEPVEEWRKWKLETTKREWDYVFRRLYYVWTPDISRTQFLPPIEVDNVDKTAGHMQNLDLWVDREGAAHLLYRKTTVADAKLRDRFLPDVRIVTSLEHCVVKEDKVIARETLLSGGEGGSGEIPGWARFHGTDDGRLFVFYHCSGKDLGGKDLDENCLMQVLPAEQRSGAVLVGLKVPFSNFMTASERGGSKPSRVLDVLGSGGSRPAIRYARIRL